MSKNRNDQIKSLWHAKSLEVGSIGLEEHKSFNVFSMEASSAVRACHRYNDGIRPNTNTLYGQLFGPEANTNRIFGTSL